MRLLPPAGAVLTRLAAAAQTATAVCAATQDYLGTLAEIVRESDRADWQPWLRARLAQATTAADLIAEAGTAQPGPQIPTPRTGSHLAAVPDPKEA